MAYSLTPRPPGTCTHTRPQTAPRERSPDLYTLPTAPRGPFFFPIPPNFFFIAADCCFMSSASLISYVGRTGGGAVRNGMEGGWVELGVVHARVRAAEGG